MKYSHIIWDWNGTLLNDVDWCVDVTRRMLSARGIKPIDVIGYRATFGFPVYEYYKRVGYNFDQETFEALSEEFISLYHAEQTGHSPLHHGAENILSAIKSLAIPQSVLSASRIDNLLLQMRCFDLEKYFDELLGLSDIYAKSKLEVGREYLARVHANSVLFIGDTTHDYEVATALGADCVLFSKGHQSRERLEKCGAPIIDALDDVLMLVS